MVAIGKIQEKSAIFQKIQLTDVPVKEKSRQKKTGTPIPQLSSNILEEANVLLLLTKK
jgi:hypothetical protein